MKLRNYRDQDFPEPKQLLIDTNVFYKPLDIQEIFQKKIDHDPQSIILVEEDHKIVGTVFIIYDPWNSFAFRLEVHPDYQGKRIANIVVVPVRKSLSLIFLL